MAVVSVLPITLGRMEGAPNPEAWVKDNGGWIKDLITDHKRLLTDIEMYQGYYDGDGWKILKKTPKREDDPNNKIVPNYAAIIIDFAVNYMVGKPVKVTVDPPKTTGGADTVDEAVLDEYRNALNKVLWDNSADAVFRELAKQGGVAGQDYIIAWLDENGDINFDEFPANECLAVYDMRGRLQLLIRYYTIEDMTSGEKVERTRVEVYDEKYITYYIQKGESEFILDDTEIDPDTGEGNPVRHFCNGIPAAVFINKLPANAKKRLQRVGVSDLGGGVITLLDEYAKILSGSADRNDYFADPYLKMVGVDVNQADVLTMRKARAITTKAAKTEAEIDFISWDQEVEAVEKHADRVKNTIYEVTCTPRLDNLTGATATEIKMKYAGLDIKVSEKEVYFAKALYRLMEVVTDMLNAKRLEENGQKDPEKIWQYIRGKDDAGNPVEAPITLFNSDWLTLTFTRSLPQNYGEIVDMVVQLIDKVPDEDLYALLWFVEDPQDVIDRMKAQRKARAKEAAEYMFDVGNEDEGQGAGGTGEEE
jgi:SPP1 family phage portal protein